MKKNNYLLTPEEKEMLRPIFWDTDINKLDFEIHKKYTIERILQFGRTEHVNWMLKSFSDIDIIDTVKRSANIDRRTANFWSIHYGINKDDILCFTKQSARSNSIF